MLFGLAKIVGFKKKSFIYIKVLNQSLYSTEFRVYLNLFWNEFRALFLKRLVQFVYPVK